MTKNIQKNNENKFLFATDIALNTLGSKRFEKIQKSGLSFEDLWTLPAGKVRGKLGREKFVDSFLKNREAINPDAKLEKLKNLDINFITIFDDEYPKLLKETFSPPAVLYYKGNLELLEKPTLAAVGSRKFTTYGKNATEKIVSGLAEAGYTIVSGMALGIDTFAHETTLRADGKTVAILGCGLDNPYPASNAGLFKKIIESDGLAISEYMPGKPPLRQHFPARNRIISGVSRGILIAEANIKSGALITARDALEQNRDVFAVPGSIFGESSGGTNKLLKMGANLITSAEDILEYYGLETKPKKSKAKPSNDKEKTIFSILEEGESHIDELIKKSGLEAQLIISTLTLMEIKGKVKNLGGMVYTLN
jgi:DNA processing protein